jgi:hypothetical protein
VAEEDFDDQLEQPHPKLDRASLEWDDHMISKRVLVYWKRVGYAGWYVGTISAYNKQTEQHTIEWEDAASWVVDLMACTLCKEWRLVQEGENVNEFLR